MKIRDMIAISKEESGEFREVTAELTVKASYTVPTLEVVSASHVDPVERVEEDVVYQIDRFLFEDARLAFEDFKRAMVLHLDKNVFRDVELYEGLQEKADRVRRLLSIDGERGYI